VILRALLLAAGLAGLVASLALGRPERFAVTLPCALLVVVVAAGAVAADAIPLRRAALACSALTLLCGLALLARGAEIPLTAAIVVLQIAAVLTPRPLRRAPGA
jgi:hypothetical protein